MSESIASGLGNASLGNASLGNARLNWLHRCLGCVRDPSPEPAGAIGNEMQRRAAPETTQAGAYRPTGPMMMSPVATDGPDATTPAGEQAAARPSPDAVMPAANADDPAEYVRQVDEWVGQATSPREQRDSAAAAIRDWQQQQDPEALLRLANFALSSLPPLPPALRRLEAPYNQLSQLPATLPAGMEELRVNRNDLTSLPGTLPPSLHTLDASSNRIGELPDALPASLQELILTYNQITTLPELPASLTTLRVGSNRLSRLPALPAGLTRLDADVNAISELPTPLPASLERLMIEFNEISVLPALPASLRTLRARQNRLSQLPALPDGLLRLDANSNRLGVLPDPLPASLFELDVDRNNIEELPALPPRLTVLRARGNRITVLPELPVSLYRLDVGANRLTRLPGNLPGSLRDVDFARNQLTAFPPNLLAPLDPRCYINLTGNDFPQDEVDALDRIVGSGDYRGPWLDLPVPVRRFVHFDDSDDDSLMEDDSADPSTALSLAESVTAWLDGEGAEAWSAFGAEEGAPEFTAFLAALRETVNFQDDQGAFRQHVAAWLARLAERPNLRQKSFLAAFGATESCEDRVTLTWNSMQRAEHEDDVETGRYDQDLPGLVTLARGMFRLDALEQIAKEKVEALYRLPRYQEFPESLDPLEVHLAYPVMLRERLQLPLHTPGMRFGSMVKTYNRDLNTPDYLEDAEQRVRAEEAQGFLRYLATWKPWEALAERLATQDHTQADPGEDLADEFQARFDARMQAEGLAGEQARALGPQVVADAERQIGAQVLAELKVERMRRMLRGRGLEHLLDPVQPADGTAR